MRVAQGHVPISNGPFEVFACQLRMRKVAVGGAVGARAEWRACRAEAYIVLSSYGGWQMESR